MRSSKLIIKSNDQKQMATYGFGRKKFMTLIQNIKLEGIIKIVENDQFNVTL